MKLIFMLKQQLLVWLDRGHDLESLSEHQLTRRKVHVWPLVCKETGDGKLNLYSVHHWKIYLAVVHLGRKGEDMVWWLHGNQRFFLLEYFSISVSVRRNISGCLYSILNRRINIISHSILQKCNQEEKILVLISQSLHLLQILDNNLCWIVDFWWQ